MTLAEIIKALSEGGITSVILGVFLFIYLRNESHRSKKADSNAVQNKKERDRKDELLKQMMQNQQNQTADLIKTISIHVQNDDSFTHEDEDIQSQIDNQIDNILAELQLETSAGRAMLVRYHNGTKDILGNSFLRMSCTNERVAVGVSPFKTQFQNQFRTLVGYLCNEIKAKEFYYIGDIEELKQEQHNTMYEFFKTRNIIGVMAQAVVSENGYVVGFILLEFLTSCPILESLQVPIKVASKEISRLLTLKKEKNNGL